MNNITINDIAKIAGVSHGTVSNALNGHGNVSAEKMKLVLDTAKSLGYVINAQAKQLRQDSICSNTIAVVLPNITESKYCILYTSICDVCRQKGYSVNLFITDNSSFTENKVLAEISAMRTAGVVAVSSCTDIQKSYSHVIQNGAQVVFALQDPGFHADYVTFDSEQIAYDLIKHALDIGAKCIGIFASNFTFVSSLPKAECGYHKALAESNRNVEIITIRSSLEAASKSAMPFFTAPVQPDVIICSSEEYARELERAAIIFGAPKCPAILAISCRTPFDNIYSLNYQKLGIQIASRLIERIEQRNKNINLDNTHAILDPDGFKVPYFPAQVNKRVCIKALLMRGHAATAIMNMSRRFTKETNIEVDYTVLSPSEIYDYIVSDNRIADFDVIRASVSILPIIPRRSVKAFNGNDHRRITHGMIEKLIGTHSIVRGEPLAIPFDIGSQIMVYRKDFFSDPILKRLYYEKYSRILKAPEDFSEYNDVSRFFTHNQNSASPVSYGSTLGFGTDSGLFLSFILRYRAFLEKSQTDSDYLPTLDFDVTMNVLNNFLELCSYSCIINDSAYFGTAHDNFVRGNSAMEIITFNYASNVPEISNCAAESQLGYTRIPGSYPSIGGGSLLISSTTKHYDASLTFVEWACGSDTAEMFTYLGGMSPHSKVYQSSEVLSLYPWYRLFPDTIAATSNRSLWDTFHVHKLEHLVAEAMRSVASRHLSPHDASVAIVKGLKECLIQQ